MYYGNLFDVCLLTTFKLYWAEKLLLDKKQPTKALGKSSIGNSLGRITGLLISRQRKLNLASVTR